MAPRDWIWDLVNCVGVLALWGIGLRRRLVSRMFWRCFLFIYVTTHVIEFFMPDPRLRDYPPALIAFVFVAVYTPYYLGMYLYAFRSDNLWDSKEQARTNRVTTSNGDPR